MALFWKALVVLLLTLPVGAYVAGGLAGPRAELPDRRPPVLVDDPAPVASSGSGTPSQGSSESPRDDGQVGRDGDEGRDGRGDDEDDDDDDDVRVVRPDPDDLDDEDDDDRADDHGDDAGDDHGGDDGDGDDDTDGD
jgi:hypothetical protein